MLEFFRRYQRFFFMIITFVVIVSFSFFGTYGTLESPQAEDPVVFTAVDGTPIKQSEIDQMTLFLGTDADDKLAFGGAWGPNFLNDGVVRNDILTSGIGQQLIMHYRNQLKEELQTRLQKEKLYSPYIHPQAKFLSADAAWSYFAPDLKGAYDKMLQLPDGSSSDAVQARIYLFLAEKRFPHYALRHVLRYQEGQYQWITPDPNLDSEDLFLFSHHTLEDWFGRQFVQLSARTVIDGAKMAEQRGYVVTKAEALADLRQNAAESYRQMEGSNEVILGGVNGYMQEQLRRMGMDLSQATKVWRQVLLFRRLFHDVGSAVFVDSLPYKQFQSYAKESVAVDLYRLPPELRFSDFRTLAKFEMYLRSVSNSSSQQLPLPTQFLSAAEVVKKYPELVQKRYLVEIVEANKNQLQSKVPLKDTWAWETEPNNWGVLAEKFPDIGVTKPTDVDQRFLVLDKLDDKTRAKIDGFARAAIVDKHPEWLDEALSIATPTKTTLALRRKGGLSTIEGATDRDTLIQLLDNTPISTEENKKAPLHYSGDGVHHYLIRVLERSPDWEVMTLAEANGDNTLETLLDAELEPYYTKVRDSSPQSFRREDGRWKQYSEVRNEVAQLYLDRLIKSVHEDAVKAGEKMLPDTPTAQFAASHRLYRPMRDLRDTLRQNPEQAAELTRQPDDVKKSDTLQSRKPLADQWKLLQGETRVERGLVDPATGLTEAFRLPIGSWSEVVTPVNGDLSFFVLKHRGYDPDPRALGKKMDEAQYLLGSEAQRLLMAELLGEEEPKAH